jgi:hypothetical protein
MKILGEKKESYEKFIKSRTESFNSLSKSYTIDEITDYDDIQTEITENF